MTKTIVFDLDGTLVHSAPDIHAAVNRMLADCGEAPLDMPTVTGFVGNGIPNLVRLVMQARDIPADAEPRMMQLMVDHYTAHPADLTRPYPGVVDALTAFRAAGHRLGVCTNKLHAPSVDILDQLDLARFFDVVIGGDSLPVKKPDPAPLYAAFEALAPEPGLYVGDSEVDAATAENAGVSFALFTRGYRKTPVEALRHHFAFDAFDDLPAWVAQNAVSAG
ncbi:phosphoglycolate phosphatase [Aestuariicoccus sp. MJ-SS9]|uniref:phosphoglycolate phosphatase n=1 Tax=Aestuariicoccus sp. MJ-SS9 TaxID=3079855 RepID=UPI00290F86E6|nr:phosphoglycolate phosphatase [Aestuariicoccus sp. MJ-SS9]MDU8909731.1 phosphoglycolate phosphatase [Aestuariicoccus sp. MJ-SS9]